MLDQDGANLLDICEHDVLNNDALDHFCGDDRGGGFRRVVAAWAQPRAPRAAAATAGLSGSVGEIDRDRAAGLIGEAEAKSARVEISRRLLAAADAEARAGRAGSATRAVRHRRARGRRGDRRRAGRRARPLSASSVRRTCPVSRLSPAPMRRRRAQSIESLVGQVEAHLARNPNDGTGWEVIAPVYMRLGRFDDAVAGVAQGDRAQRRNRDARSPISARLWSPPPTASSPTKPSRRSNTPWRRCARGQGALFSRPGRRAGRQQRRRRRQMARVCSTRAARRAVGGFRARGAGARHRRRRSPADAAPAPGRAPAMSRRPKNIDEAQRTRDDPRHGARLADRLHADGNDVDGWLRLVRAYAVLGDRDKAKDAAADARRALCGPIPTRSSGSTTSSKVSAWRAEGP